jgi:integrase/recombinase XerD
MMDGSAIILRPEHRDQLFEAIPFQSPMPARDNLVFSMSFFNAMRVCEIAEIPIDRMLGPRGEILGFIRIIPETTKRDGRTIPMHPRVRQALEEFLDAYPDAEWVAISPRDPRPEALPMTAAALGRAMERLYRNCGFGGCRSHTGRATCITEMASMANMYGCNLAEVQRFAGHKRLETTANYLGATGNITSLVDALGNHRNQQRRTHIAQENSGPIYWTPESVGSTARRAGRPDAAGQPRADSDGRRDAERLAAREAHRARSRRKLRQNRPFRRDR